MPQTKTKTLVGSEYSVTHKLKRVADIHEKKLKKRGAKVKRTKTKQGYKLKYTF